MDTNIIINSEGIPVFEETGTSVRQRGTMFKNLLEIAREHVREEKAARLEKLQEALVLYSSFVLHLQSIQALQPRALRNEAGAYEEYSSMVLKAVQMGEKLIEQKQQLKALYHAS